MKFNVLVVAAMVITSVNAVWYDVFTGCFRGRCGSNKPRVPKHIKVTSKCGPIVEKLTDLRRETYNIEDELRERMPTYFNLMRGMYTDGDKIDPSMLKAEQVTAYLKLSDDDKAIVEGFKANHAGLMKEYRKTWKKYNKCHCFTEYPRLFSPDEVAKSGLFPKLQDKKDVISPNKQ
ncbi:hypothetical protein BASA50_008013 [Batrachochytrium salamandrivorans]|uniref:Uncharacterized protein n=1 Tax=Batrachochytrium salamandrivorans TaxID=1357716 RepID=A0ABQ8F5F3_9FUNG|nr:hypothetical protein BASA60_006561 [Batrachochytrium salamandrivorans]KAH6592562.1 hypothetical protein BASA50_008013 [Batrachochytrium salamandrivorans]KAH6598342.1 hypothetical protein BASA61_002897 [Batrachochytrium salamandrivorans]KAH9245397.1 hypothetical protein BASA81_017131 [Batrachochytrium salamandrivorans]KAH9273400.1 hypothetical protein BASA83_004404 [Batrachochytrium salamandrivorans]